MEKLYKEKIFGSKDLTVHLAQRSFNSGIVTMATQFIRYTLSTIGTVILARLLTPDEYGLVGMAMIIVAFARMFMEAGLSIATIQREKITHQQTSNLFWVNVLIGLILCLAVLSSSQFVAKFYGKPELVAITATLSLVFLISGPMIQHEALLKRYLKFNSIAVIQITAEIATLIITILLALWGFKYWALIGGTLTTTIFRFFGIFYFCRWIPGKFDKGTTIWKDIKFGQALTLSSIIDYFSLNLDKILIGKYIGVSSLGLYHKAYRLYMLPITQIRMPITNVAIPSLSALKEQPERYIKYYQRLIDLLATVTIPLTLFCAIEADFIILLLLGSNWLELIPLFRILAIAGIILPVAQTQGLVLISFGLSQKYLFYTLANNGIKIIAIIVGLYFGLKGIAYGIVIANYIILLPSLFYCFHNTPVNVSLFLKSIIAPILTSSLACSIYLLLKSSQFNDSIIMHFVFLGVFFIIYTGVSCTRKSIRETLVMVYKMFTDKGKK